MIYSNERKRCLSGWLHENNQAAYMSPLKLQKFLFLYEAFSKISNEPYDFSHLKGYKRGPVFSTVWGDYTKDRDEFEQAAVACRDIGDCSIDSERAEKVSFIVSTLSETELSDFTHKLDMWKAKEDRIMSGEQQVDLAEEDFSKADAELLTELKNLYSDDIVKNSRVIQIDDRYFVFSKEDAVTLTEQQMDTLVSLARHKELLNPVFVTINDGGCLIVD